MRRAPSRAPRTANRTVLEIVATARSLARDVGTLADLLAGVSVVVQIELVLAAVAVVEATLLELRGTVVFVRDRLTLGRGRLLGGTS